MDQAQAEKERDQARDALSYIVEFLIGSRPVRTLPTEALCELAKHAVTDQVRKIAARTV